LSAATDAVLAKPILKWAGGKAKLLPELLRRTPSTIGTYAEPFAGGAALFFALASESPRRFRHAVLNDANPDLAALYRAVRDDVEGLVAELEVEDYANTAERFAEIRADHPGEAWSDVQRGARMLYLNRTCFNGLWRTNGQGRFNVPFGRYANPRICDPEGLRAASRALAGVEILCGDFFHVTRTLVPGDFAYCDPPYVPLTNTANFAAYVKGGFGPTAQESLARELRRLQHVRVRALLSNADTPVTRDLYEGLRVEGVSAARAISCTGDRTRAAELLVTTFPWEPPAPPPPSCGISASA
jgi:DNA adenine methylase